MFKKNTQSFSLLQELTYTKPSTQKYHQLFKHGSPFSNAGLQGALQITYIYGKAFVVTNGIQLIFFQGEKEQKPMISLSIQFNSPTNELTIVLSRGKNLICNADGQHQHIQISAILMPDGNILHSCKGIPPNPFFKHKYNFQVKADNLESSSVKFNVWKIDKYSRQIPFGECILDLGNAFADIDNYLKDLWLAVQPRDKLVFRFNDFA